MTRSVREVAEFVSGRVLGNDKVLLLGISSLESASFGDLVFVEDEKNLARAMSSQASAVLVGDFVSDPAEKPLIVTPRPRLAFARAANLLHPQAAKSSGIHATAVVHPSARVAHNVSVEAHVVIGENAVIDGGTRIGAGTVIGDHVSIGRDCHIYPRVTIYAGVVLGDRVVVHAGAVLGSDGFGYVRDSQSGHYQKFPQVGRLEIAADVEIGANATIDRGALDVTRIGRGVKIDNLVHVGHNVHIGEDVVIAAQTGISGSSSLGKDVVVGGQVGIADHVRIEDGAILGAQSGVPSKKVIRGKGIVFWGTPARPIREYLKQLAAIARLSKKE